MNQLLPLSLLSFSFGFVACGVETAEPTGEAEGAIVIGAQYCQNVFDALPSTFLGEAPIMTVTFVSGKTAVLIQDIPGLESSSRVGMYGDWEAARSEFGAVSGSYALVFRKRFTNLGTTRIQNSSVLDFQLFTQAGATWANFTVVPTECSSNGRQVTLVATGPNNARLTAVIDHFYIGG
jgi:hypothetical protein